MLWNLLIDTYKEIKANQPDIVVSDYQIKKMPSYQHDSLSRWQCNSNRNGETRKRQRSGYRKSLKTETIWSKTYRQMYNQNTT